MNIFDHEIGEHLKGKTDEELDELADSLLKELDDLKD